MKKSSSVILFGNGKMGEIFYQYFIKDANFSIDGWAADKEYVKTDKFCNLPLIDFDNIEKQFPPRKHKIIITLSGKNMRYRKNCFEKIKKKGYEFENYVSRSSLTHSDLKMGVNNIICAGTHIGPFATIGDNNIIREKTYVGHDSYIGNHNIICPGCNISGYVKIHNLCFIGIGSVFIEKIILNDETLVGAGSVIIKDTEKYSVYVGNPGRKIKSHKNTGILL